MLTATQEQEAETLLAMLLTENADLRATVVQLLDAQECCDCVDARACGSAACTHHAPVLALARDVLSRASLARAATLPAPPPASTRPDGLDADPYRYK